MTSALHAYSVLHPMQDLGASIDGEVARRSQPLAELAELYAAVLRTLRLRRIEAQEEGPGLVPRGAFAPHAVAPLLGVDEAHVLEVVLERAAALVLFHARRSRAHVPRYR